MKQSREFVEEVRTRASLARYAEKRINWDPKKSRPDHGEFWACCPFHQEKTPSFSITDRDGLYYCFGCHAGGDIFKFVQEIENVGFPEALQILAAQAGISVPEMSAERSEQIAQETAQAERLHKANAVALVYYTECLADAKGRAARKYLQETRGLSDEIIQQFRLGYAPDRRGELAAKLEQAGVAEADAITAGLLRRSDNSSDIYDFFRNRIMFPILDPRGRCIAFGGRAMSEDARAKYLNSPESPVFQKGRTLYNYGPAREAARKSGRLLAVEGYMDVIAMAVAGFADVVAPLGTAMREDHFALTWQAAPKLVLAFDGDEAGQRAAGRAADLGLASIRPECELFFALLPEGQDPDDLIQAHGGGEGIRQIVDHAIPLAELIWRRVMSSGATTSPEQIAALERKLKEQVDQIKDPRLAYHYRQYFRDRVFKLSRGGRRRSDARGGAIETRMSALAGGTDTGPGYAARGRATIILQTLLSHPLLAGEFCEQLGELEFQQEDLELLRREIISAIAEGDLGEGVRAELEARFEPSLRRVPHVREVPYAKAGADLNKARKGLRITLEEHRRLENRRRQLEAAEEGICEEDAGDELVHDVRAVIAEVEDFGMSISVGHSLEDQSEIAQDELRKMLSERIWESQPHRGTGELRNKADG